MKLNNFFSFLILFLIFVLACTPQVQTAASSVQPQDRVRNVELLKNGNASNVES